MGCCCIKVFCTSRFFQCKCLCDCVAAVGDFFDPFGMGTSSGVGSSVGSSQQSSGPDLFVDLLGSESSNAGKFPPTHANPAPSNSSLFDLSKYQS